MPQGTVPRISVIMPAYNAEKYLSEAIDSILNQTFTDFEFIIINDGSTDSSKDIILSYTDPRIVYFENEQNSGICVTLNKGLEAAKGEYIARMDSDDISMPDRFDVQVKYLDNNAEIGAIGTDLEIFGEGIKPYVFTQFYTPQECEAALLFNSCFAHPSVMMRKSILTNNRLKYKNEYRGLEDYELWWQIHKYAKLNNISKPLLRYRQHKGQETKNVDSRVKNAFSKFITLRFSDIGIELKDHEINLINSYSVGDFKVFNDKNIATFIALSKKIKSSFSHGDGCLLKAVSLTLSQAITCILSHSRNYYKLKQSYYNQCLRQRIFPLIWYGKVTYHNLMK